MRGMSIFGAVGLMVGLLAGGCGKASDAPPAGPQAAPPKAGERPDKVLSPEQLQDRGRLEEATSGYWVGPAGSLDFRADGSARIELRSCGHRFDADGNVEVGFDCAPQVYEGKYKRTGLYQFEVRSDEDETEVFSALPIEKRFYVAPLGTIARFGEREEEGTLVVGEGKWIVVKRHGCRYFDATGRAEKSMASACTWATKGGVRTFTFDVPSPYDERRRDAKSLIQFDSFLVPPYVPFYRFERSNARPANPKLDPRFKGM